jgi:hypothetical protein
VVDFIVFKLSLTCGFHSPDHKITSPRIRSPTLHALFCSNSFPNTPRTLLFTFRHLVACSPMHVLSSPRAPSTVPRTLFCSRPLTPSALQCTYPHLLLSLPLCTSSRLLSSFPPVLARSSMKVLSHLALFLARSSVPLISSCPFHCSSHPLPCTCTWSIIVFEVSRTCRFHTKQSMLLK